MITAVRGGAPLPTHVLQERWVENSYRSSWWVYPYDSCCERGGTPAHSCSSGEVGRELIYSGATKYLYFSQKEGERTANTIFIKCWKFFPVCGWFLYRKVLCSKIFKSLILFSLHKLVSLVGIFDWYTNLYFRHLRHKGRGHEFTNTFCPS